MATVSEHGAIQVVITDALLSDFEGWLSNRNLSLFKMQGLNGGDLDTYGVMAVEPAELYLSPIMGNYAMTRAGIEVARASLTNALNHLPNDAPHDIPRRMRVADDKLVRALQVIETVQLVPEDLA